MSFVNHFVVGFFIAAVALPAHTLPLPPVWGYLPIESKRGLCTCCCGKIGETQSPPRRPALSMPFRLWTLLLFAIQVCRKTVRTQRQHPFSDRLRWCLQCAGIQAAHSPPVLLALWVCINDGSISLASDALVQMVKIYASAPAGCTPWLPFVRCRCVICLELHQPRAPDCARYHDGYIVCARAAAARAHATACLGHEAAVGPTKTTIFGAGRQA